MSINPQDVRLGSTASGDSQAIDEAYQELMAHGLSSAAAGTIVDHIIGLHAAELGWTVEEIRHFVAIRSFATGKSIES